MSAKKHEELLDEMSSVLSSFAEHLGVRLVDGNLRLEGTVTSTGTEALNWSHPEFPCDALTGAAIGAALAEKIRKLLVALDVPRVELRSGYSRAGKFKITVRTVYQGTLVAQERKKEPKHRAPGARRTVVEIFIADEL